MQEYLNGKLFIDGQFKQLNFLIKDGKFYFDYQTGNYEQIDLKGLIVTPGFIDLHVHSRIPGQEYKEDLAHLTEAALAGGFTTLVLMGNVQPLPVDDLSYSEVLSSLKAATLNFFQVGRVTNQGTISPINKLYKQTKLFSDDGEPISKKSLMLEALKEAKKYDVTLLLHEENITTKGLAYTSPMTEKNQLPSFGPEYEWEIIKRDIDLNKGINCKIHFQHISVAKSIELIKEAKLAGMPISCEVTPHHLYFSNHNIPNHGNYKMNPPLGSKEDNQTLIKAFGDGWIDAIATDHAPHSNKEKDTTFDQALNGVIGLESAFAAVNTVLGEVEIEKVIAALTIKPASIIGIESGFVNGQEANLVIIDQREEWVFSKKDIRSKSHNSPFLGQKFVGKVKKVIYKKIERSF